MLLNIFVYFRNLLMFYWGSKILFIINKGKWYNPWWLLVLNYMPDVFKFYIIKYIGCEYIYSNDTIVHFYPPYPTNIKIMKPVISLQLKDDQNDKTLDVQNIFSNINIKVPVYVALKYNKIKYQDYSHLNIQYFDTGIETKKVKITDAIYKPLCEFF